MDIATTTAPKSDQMNHDDVVAGPLTVTVAQVIEGSAEQPVEIHTHEYPGRPFKPSKTVRRVLQTAWGRDTDPYAGRRMVLVSDPTVKFGGAVVGGIRISHLSHIEKPITLALTATRGKKGHHTIEPLVEAAPVDWAAQVEGTGGDVEALRRLWTDASKAGADEDTLNRIAQAAQEATT